MKAVRWLTWILLAALAAPTLAIAAQACWAPFTEEHANTSLCWFRDEWRRPDHNSSQGNNSGPVVLGATRTGIHEKTNEFIRTCVYQPPGGEPIISRHFYWLRSRLKKAIELMSFETPPETFITSVDLCEPVPGQESILAPAQGQSPASNLDHVCEHTIQETTGGLDYTIIEFRYRDSKSFCSSSIGARHIFFQNGNLATVYWVAAANNGWPILLNTKPDGTLERKSQVGGNKVRNAEECKQQALAKGDPIAVYDNKRCQTGYLQDPSDTGDGKRKNTAFENLAQPW